MRVASNPRDRIFSFPILKPKVCVDMKLNRVLAGIVAAVAIFALACGTSPAEFTITALNIPTEADVWERVRIEAVVQNTGGEQGIFPATLSIDGVAIETKELTLSGGDEGTVTFDIMRTVGPTAEVSIGGSSGVMKINEGVLPSLDTGDIWEMTLISDGVETAATFEITGEETIGETNTYAGLFSFEPALEGVISSGVVNLDMQTFREMRFEASAVSGVPFSMVVTAEHQPSDSNLYPLSVGKKVTVTEVESTEIVVAGDQQNETETNTYTYIVEGIEEVTVPAGTFRSFKIVKYDDTGNALETNWSSDAVKGFDVKTIDHESGETFDLISYSLVGADG